MTQLADRLAAVQAPADPYASEQVPVSPSGRGFDDDDDDIDIPDFLK